MGNLTVAVIGAPEYAKNLGKKSTISDITFFDQKKGDSTITFVEPTKYPEKLAPLFYAASMADIALVVIDQINPILGESILMLDCVGVKSGYIVLRNFLTPEQIAPFIKDTVLDNYVLLIDDPIRIRESLMAEAEKLRIDGPPAENTSAGSTPIDHFFDVKGIGTVILGWVAEGFVRRHDKMRILPGTMDTEIRSIQKHDDDFNWAAKGDRVGIALKGVEVDGLERGMVLTNEPSLKCTSKLTARANLVKYWLNPIKPGMVIHLGHWMQFVPARVEEVMSGDDWRKPSLTLSLQKELVFQPGSRAVITHLEGGKLRVMGTIELRG
jgi:selenocysteine-specific translation elongation factor